MPRWMILLVVGKAQDLVAVRPPLKSMGCLCRLLCVQAMKLIHQTPICLSSAPSFYDESYLACTRARIQGG